MRTPDVERDQDPRSYAVIGAAMEVRRHLGNGFLEAVYQEALELELRERQVSFVREANLPIFYKGKPLNTVYRPDFICYDAVIVELKAISKVTAVEEAQVFNYLKASKFQVALLLNFGTPSLGVKRFVFTQSAQSV
jgi:GxxExxY protein